MSKALNREVNSFIDAAIEQGFRVKEKKSGVMIFGGDSGAVMLHRTPSDSRGVKNARARLRAMGVSL